MGCSDSEYREICFCISVGQIGVVTFMLFDNNMDEDIVVPSHFCKFCKRNDTAFIEFYIGVKDKKSGQDVRKAETAKKRTANGGEVSELDTDDIFDGFTDVSGAHVVYIIVEFMGS